jgi:glycosyltransferase involved in cell wall biosynthesis
MRICFVIEQGGDLLINGGRHYTGGSERQQVLLARALRMRGHTTRFIVADGERSGPVETEHGVVDRLAFAQRRWSSPFAQYGRAVARAAARANADVYYCRAVSNSLLPTALWSRANGKVCVYAAAHDSDTALRVRELRLPVRGWRRIGYVAGLHLANRVLAQHEYQRSAFLRLGVRASVVPNAVELPDRSRIQRNGGLASSGGYVLAIGRIDPQKRPELVLRLARTLAHRRFVLLGGGKAAAVDRFRREAAGVTNLEWVGHVEADRVEAYLASASVLVNTSVMEGFPNTFLESWAWGVPVVSLSVDPGGVMKDNGLGSCSGDVAIMSQRVEQLLDSAPLWESLGQRCRSYVERHHAVDVVADRLLEEFQMARGAPGIGG